ncbi:MAG: single-stranded-DNA-specific exonuclease RecJ [Planctomycetota bacterium]|nr:single-stranded-DNA-specific exonuclease RecJ [Planctomycetota bacterium]
MGRGLRCRWIEPSASGVPVGWAGPPLVGRLLAQRGIQDQAEADHFLQAPLTGVHDPQLLPNITEVAEAVLAELDNNEGRTLWIHGDYDADGITGSTILARMLRQLRPQAAVQIHVPDRMTEGYGISVAKLEQIAAGGDRMVVSVDCGITALEAAQRAKELGLTLLITDHHKPLQDESGALCLPNVPIVHPGIGGYPFDGICGAVVAWKLAWMCARLAAGDEEGRLPSHLRSLLADLTSLAAIGTIADVVPLEEENRMIAAWGLRHIARCRIPGVEALLRVANLENKRQLTAMEVGFRLGPRLNAVGRLGKADAAVELLCTSDSRRAESLAVALDEVNQERQELTKSMAKEAEAMALANGFDQDDRRCVILCGDDWHPGVVGIVASRMVERFGRPAILLAREDNMLRGSARSIDGYSIHAGIESAKEHVQKFGGHDMAAGLSLAVDQFEDFTAAVLEHARCIDPENLTPALRVSADATLAEIDVDLIQWLQQLEPFGRSNPEPLVRIHATLDQVDPIGRTGSHVAIRLRTEDASLRAIWFNASEWLPRLARGRRVRVLGVPRENRFRGSVTAELEVKDLALIAESEPC